jgi:hypothetical protein
MLTVMCMYEKTQTRQCGCGYVTQHVHVRLSKFFSDAMALPIFKMKKMKHNIMLSLHNPYLINAPKCNFHSAFSLHEASILYQTSTHVTSEYFVSRHHVP